MLLARELEGFDVNQVQCRWGRGARFARHKPSLMLLLALGHYAVGPCPSSASPSFPLPRGREGCLEAWKAPCSSSLEQPRTSSEAAPLWGCTHFPLQQERLVAQHGLEMA